MVMQMELAKKQKATTSNTRIPVKLRTAILVLSTLPESEGATTAVWLKYFLFLRTPEVKLKMLYFSNETYTLVPAVINREGDPTTKNRPPKRFETLGSRSKAKSDLFLSRDKFSNFPGQRSSFYPDS